MKRSNRVVIQVFIFTVFILVVALVWLDLITPIDI
ncbi:hypothetical protein Brsp05_04360 [Brucella sp. NBRC 12953]